MSETVTNNLSVPVTDLAAGGLPTQVFSSTHRTVITAASLHNKSAEQRVVTVYLSPDSTAASGEEIDKYTLEAGETTDIFSLLGQGLEANGEERVIAVMESTGSELVGDINCKMSYNEYIVTA